MAVLHVSAPKCHGHVCKSAVMMSYSQNVCTVMDILDTWNYPVFSFLGLLTPLYTEREKKQ